MNLLERNKFAGLAISPLEDLQRKTSHQHTILSPVTTMQFVGRIHHGLTHCSIGTLAQLLQLLERAGMSFAVHVCGRELGQATVRKLSLRNVVSWMSEEAEGAFARL